jgi:hypothetical protein
VLAPQLNLGTLDRHYEAMRPEHAHRSWVRAHNYRLENELYLNPGTAEAAAQITDDLIKLFGAWEHKMISDSALRTKADAVSVQIKRLKGILRLELNGTDPVRTAVGSATV